MRISEFELRHDHYDLDTLTRSEENGLIALTNSCIGTAGRPLDVNDFAAVVSATPLIAIDLIVRDHAGRTLFGLRRNPPASGYWFVPGGRVYKNERLDDAFRRISKAELGIDIKRRESRLLGVFEHFYDTNFLGEPCADTHYVVLAHVVEAGYQPINPPRQQHCAYAWLHESEVARHADIHPYAKAYFPCE